jgi:IS30 family transposase
MHVSHEKIYCSLFIQAKDVLKKEIIKHLRSVQVDGKGTKSVVSALCREVGQLPRGLKKSPTWGRRGELGNHKEFTVATDIQIYFCDPQSPWQRGSNESTNRLLRQCFSKKTDISGYSQEQLNVVTQRPNEWPKKLSASSRLLK